MSKSTEELVHKGQETMSKSYAPRQTIMDRGDGMYLQDLDGNRYLDFLAGIAVNTLGYAHPDLTAAIADQAAKALHVSNVFFTEPQVKLQDFLTELTFASWVFPCNSGAEANEAAIKLCRRYQRVVKGSPRFEIITFDKSFHGRTYGAISATAQPKYHAGFEPMVPGFVYAKYNDIEDVKSKVGPHTAGILIEPIQGEGGIRPADPVFLQALRDLCDAEGIVLMFDEVQCGVGRTGSWFAYQHYGVEPDVMTLAKGLGGGVPIGAMLAREELREGFTRGSHATTFGGNPLAARAAVTVLDVIERDGLLEQVQDVSAHFCSEAAKLVAEFDGLTEVRGVGLMLGIVTDDKLIDANAIATAAFSNGLLFNVAGGNVLRFVPPLIATCADVDVAIERLRASIPAGIKA